MNKKRLKEYCDVEFENISMVLNELFSVLDENKSEYSKAELAAIATFLHNYYSGTENIIKRVLQFENCKIKNSATWHKDLLKICFEKGIIAEELFHSLLSFLSFRHYFVHSYSFNLRWEELKPLVNTVKETNKNISFSIYNWIDNLK